MQFNTICQVEQDDGRSPSRRAPTIPSTPRRFAGSISAISGVIGGSARLIDVCSYPSNIVNSDPSDCILFTACTTNGEL